MTSERKIISEQVTKASNVICAKDEEVKSMDQFMINNIYFRTHRLIGGWKKFDLN